MKLLEIQNIYQIIATSFTCRFSFFGDLLLLHHIDPVLSTARFHPDARDPGARVGIPLRDGGGRIHLAIDVAAAETLLPPEIERQVIVGADSHVLQ